MLEFTAHGRPADAPATARRPHAAALGLMKAAGPPLWITALVLAGLLLLAPGQAGASLAFSAAALLRIAPFFALSIGLAAGLRAMGADALIAKVFVGRELRMILAAAVFGAFSPFCSCGVIPVVTGLLIAGVPLAPIMTFWMASPAMDPELFVLLAGSAGLSFALAKTVAVLAISVVAGLLTMLITRSGLIADPLRLRPACGCGGGQAKSGAPAWRFWRERERRELFVREALKTSLFLGRWLVLAFLLESLMVAYAPADAIARWLGEGAPWSIPMAAGLGAVAYLNSYAAIPLVSGLMDLGMSPAVALTFMLAGTMTSVPAALAVWAAVKARVFALYLLFTAGGALAAGYGYLAWLSL